MVEVAYAAINQQVIIAVQIQENGTVQEAIELSGILTQFPEINLNVNKVGIFSKIVPLNQILRSGDRVEIYRPLTIDPKQARLLREKRSKAKTTK